MTKYQEFAEKFGEDNAKLVLSAAHSHRDDTPYTNYGGDTLDDEFRWAIFAVIGCECISRFSEYHGFTCSQDEVDGWLKMPEQREWLRAHKGDADYLALFCGAYDPYLLDESQQMEMKSSEGA